MLYPAVNVMLMCAACFETLLESALMMTTWRHLSWYLVTKRGASSSSACAGVVNFVPASRSIDPSDLERLQAFVSRAQRLFVITGAGLSTESGIPDYRSEGVGLYARTDRRPMQHMEFVRSAKSRQRYWARNYMGWPQFSSHRPNSAHLALRDWEAQGKVHWLVTQNVDALHSKAGHQRFTELHGCTHRQDDSVTLMLNNSHLVFATVHMTVDLNGVKYFFTHQSKKGTVLLLVACAIRPLSCSLSRTTSPLSLSYHLTAIRNLNLKKKKKWECGKWYWYIPLDSERCMTMHGTKGQWHRTEAYSYLLPLLHIGPI